MLKTTQLTLLFLSSLISFPLMSQTPCVNGKSGSFPCNQVELYARIDNFTLSGQSGIEGADIWGWTDPDTGKEYALMCQTSGVVFVDVSTPASPVIIGRLASYLQQNSNWRDVKVYNDYAFVVADNNPGHGMQVFDLKKLRDYTGEIISFSSDARYTGISSAHNVVINEEKALAYIVGARNGSNGCVAGGMHIVDISDPLAPVFAGCFDADGYTHDAQVVTYNGPDFEYVGKQIGFNLNENTITIADLEDPANPSLISKQGYSQSNYAHQGWLTEDHKYFISNDELDEFRNNVGKTRTLIWDVTDLNRPTLIDAYFSQENTIDHNLYIHNQMVYQSNYERGVVILDGSRVGGGQLRETAFFDTYPDSNNDSFNGSWSNYPYFSSGTLIVSDINGGLFILKPAIQDVISIHPSFGEVSTEYQLTVEVNTGIEVASYEWQIKAAEGFTAVDGSKAFYDGVNTKTLTIDNSAGFLDGEKYRCKVTLADGSFTYSFTTRALVRDENITSSNDEISNEVSVYPNPTIDQFYINTSKMNSSSFNLTVYDQRGKIIMKKELTNNDLIKTDSWATGMYLLALEGTGGETIIKKLIKH